ncbi:MAG: phage portal protein [Chloroflexi bacterium]|nr:phage portal protein [Chloroflexota bacterium]
MAGEAEGRRLVRYSLGGQSRQIEIIDARAEPAPAPLARAAQPQAQLMASSGAPQMTLEDLARLLGRSGDAIDKLPVVFGCLRIIISRIQNMPPRVLNSSGQIAPSPVWMRDASGIWDWGDSMSQAAYSLLQEGELLLLPGFDSARRPVGFVVLDPNMVQIYKSDSGPRPRLLYMINGVPAERVIHVRYLALPGEARGLGTERARRRAGEIGIMAEETILRHFSQGARLQTVFTAKDQTISPEMAREATFELQAHYGGIENAWRPVAIGGGYSVQTLSQNAEQAQYSQLSQWADARIAAQLYGCDPSLLGIVQQGSQLTYQNAQDREGNLFRDAIRPVARPIERAFGQMVSAGRRFDLWESPILAGGPRDRVNYAKELAAINQAVGGWLISPDQILDAIGLPALGENAEIEPLPSLAAPAAEADESPADEPEGEEQSDEDRRNSRPVWRNDLSALGISPNGH